MKNLIFRFEWTNLTLFIIVLIFGVFTSCKQNHMNQKNERKTYVLNWKNYDGTGDPKNAIYFLEGIFVGKGKHGINHLKENIDRMEEGDIILLKKNYSRDHRGMEDRNYPFNIKYGDESGDYQANLEKYAQERGINIIPEEIYYKK